MTWKVGPQKNYPWLLLQDDDPQMIRIHLWDEEPEEMTDRWCFRRSWGPIERRTF